MEKTLEIHLEEQRNRIADAVKDMKFAFSEGDYPETVPGAIAGTVDTVSKAIRFNMF